MQHDDGDEHLLDVPLVPVMTFGVGCFHFGLTEAPAGVELDDFCPKNFQEHLRAHLARYPNIENISTSGFDSFVGRGMAIEDVPLPTFANRVGIYPWPGQATVYFEVHISESKQNALNPFGGAVEDEYFSVAIKYTGSLPVAFVWGRDELLSDPSFAVAIVRNYLTKYEQPDPNGIKFQFLGPSPFHADFRINVVTDGPYYSCDRTELSGYDDVQVMVGELASSSLADVDKYLELLAIELGHYYDAVLSTHDFQLRWTDIEERVEKAVDDAKRLRGVLSWFWLPGHRNEIDLLSLDVASFEIDWQIERRRLLEDTKRDSTPYGLTYFQHDIERELADVDGNAVAETGKIIQILDARTVRELGVFYLVVTAILGGAVGSILTRLLS